MSAAKHSNFASEAFVRAAWQIEAIEQAAREFVIVGRFQLAAYMGS
jgi:hypothetical protein